MVIGECGDQGMSGRCYSLTAGAKKLTQREIYKSRSKLSLGLVIAYCILISDDEALVRGIRS